MNIVWGWPIGLAALAALLLPIWLHLDRRRSMRVLRFAAMRFIGTAHPPKRTWRLTEWLLLALRLLLLAAVVAWLALPQLLGEWRTPQRVLVVDPELSASLIREHTDGMDRALWVNSARAEIELAAIDLAETDLTQVDPAATRVAGVEPAQHLGKAPLASLLRQLDAELAAGDQLRVLLREQVSGLDAHAIGLSREVEWRIARAAGATGSEPSTQANAPAKRTLAIRYEAADAPALRWLRAASEAWAGDDSMQVAIDDQPASAALPSQIDALIWLGGKPSAAAQASLAAGTRLLHMRDADVDAAAGAGADAAAAAQAEADVEATDAPWPGRTQRVGRGIQTDLSASFDPQHLPILHSPEFPAALFSVVFGEPPAPSRAYAEQVEPTLVRRPAEPAKTPLRPWLGCLIAGLFLLERMLASGRRLRGAR